MRFKPGDKVVCLASGDWVKQNNFSWLQILGLKSKKSNGPKFNEIVTVDSWTCAPYEIALKEYSTMDGNHRHTYSERCFAPLVSDAVLEAELSSCREPNFV